LAKDTFHKLLLGAVDSALSSLGDSAKQSVYFHLEKEFEVTRNTIPSRVEDFDHGLEKIFGVGSQFLELMIMRRLYEEMGAKGKILRVRQGEAFRFVDYVKAAERAYLHTGKHQNLPTRMRGSP
jgi:hypothetical protein